MIQKPKRWLCETPHPPKKPAFWGPLGISLMPSAVDIKDTAQKKPVFPLSALPPPPRCGDYREVNFPQAEGRRGMEGKQESIEDGGR